MRDYTGQQRYGLTALKPTELRVRRAVVWECRCSCGRICLVPFGDPSYRSCGCWMKHHRSRLGRISTSRNLSVKGVQHKHIKAGQASKAKSALKTIEAAMKKRRAL